MPTPSSILPRSTDWFTSRPGWPCSPHCRRAGRLRVSAKPDGAHQGNLSSHLVKLEQGGLVSIEKTFVGKQPITYVALTGEAVTC